MKTKPAIQLADLLRPGVRLNIQIMDGPGAGQDFLLTVNSVDVSSPPSLENADDLCPATRDLDAIADARLVKMMGLVFPFTVRPRTTAKLRYERRENVIRQLVDAKRDFIREAGSKDFTMKSVFFEKIWPVVFDAWKVQTKRSDYIAKSCQAILHYPGEDSVRCGRNDGIELINGVWLCNTHKRDAA